MSLMAFPQLFMLPFQKEKAGLSRAEIKGLLQVRGPSGALASAAPTSAQLQVFLCPLQV